LTTGQISLDPGSPSIVPGKAEMVFQFRDTDKAMLARLDEELQALVAEAQRGPCKVSLVRTGATEPAAMDARFQDAFAAAAAEHAAGKFQRMPSGAGHDAQILAGVMPSGMLFVPSIRGISHHYAEDTSDADLVLGCQVFVDAAGALLPG
jgi:N-carbamoyl-L-amino-acid hydrolase